MGSPRYLAEHMLMPRFLREQGAPAVLDAIERNDADFFIPVWMDAGFRFTPKLVYRTRGELLLGVLTLPTSSSARRRIRATCATSCGRRASRCPAMRRAA